MASALGVKNVEFRRVNLQEEQLADVEPADFVLAFGLFYHLENPVQVLRLASRLCRKHILIETQVTGLEITGKVELGSHLIQVDIQGTFAMVADFPQLNVGGTGGVSCPVAQYACVPSQGVWFRDSGSPSTRRSRL
jgi:tRNA (mo5U34)-methyltransferase